MKVKLAWSDQNLHAARILHREEGAGGLAPRIPPQKRPYRWRCPRFLAPGRPPSRDAPVRGPVPRLSRHQGIHTGWKRRLRDSAILRAGLLLSPAGG